MPKPFSLALTMLACAATCAMAGPVRAAGDDRGAVAQAVDGVIRPLLRKDGIPGMAVGVVVAGRPYVFNYGLASLKPRRPVTGNTLFELGSVSKTFTATLAAWAQARHVLSLSDTAGTHLPALKGRPFGRVTLLELGTHTAGGFPLQVPEGVNSDDQLMAYLGQWRPTCEPGRCRTYSNVSIGVLGLIVARAMGQDFVALMQRRLLPALGMHSSYLRIPKSRMRDYAEGYTQDGKPIRMVEGELAAEAYGVRSTAADMLAFLQAYMGLRRVSPALRRAMAAARTAYFRAGPLEQDLIWEQYPYPVALHTLLEGNSPAMIFRSTPASGIASPRPSRGNVWIDKTGSTNGFGAYVAFVPARRFGIVILANRSFPIRDRVTTAYAILAALAGRVR